MLDAAQRHGPRWHRTYHMFTANMRSTFIPKTAQLNHNDTTFLNSGVVVNEIFDRSLNEPIPTLMQYAR